MRECRKAPILTFDGTLLSKMRLETIPPEEAMPKRLTAIRGAKRKYFRLNPDGQLFLLFACDGSLTLAVHVNILASVNALTGNESGMPMALEKKTKRALGAREQQIMDVIFQLGKASVAEVRERLTAPPSYSTVRTMIGHLERKGFVRRDRNGVKHFYSPVKSRRSASRSALRSVIETFFPSSPGDALAALIDDTAGKLSDEDLDRLEAAIQRARREDA